MLKTDKKKTLHYNKNDYLLFFNNVKKKNFPKNHIDCRLRI